MMDRRRERSIREGDTSPSIESGAAKLRPEMQPPRTEARRAETPPSSEM